MGSSGFDITNPFFFITVAGVFAGGTICSLGSIFARPREARPARSIKLVVAPLLAACSILSVLAAGLTSDPRSFLDIRLLYAFAAVTVMAFVSIRFPRALGIPLLVGFSVAFVFFSVSMIPWKHAAEEIRVADVRILAGPDGIDDSRHFSAEVIPERGGSLFIRIPEGQMTVKAQLIRNADYVFWDSAVRYRIMMIGGNPLVSDSTVPLLTAWFERLLPTLPWMRSNIIEVESEELYSPSSFTIFVGPEGVRIVPLFLLS